MHFVKFGGDWSRGSKENQFNIGTFLTYNSDGQPLKRSRDPTSMDGRYLGSFGNQNLKFHPNMLGDFWMATVSDSVIQVNQSVVLGC